MLGATKFVRRLLDKSMFGTASVWGGRNLEYLNGRFDVFIQDNEGEEFDQAKLPSGEGFLFTSNGNGRKAFVAPCSEASTEFVIKDLLNEGWTVKGIARPETNIRGLEAVFKNYLSAEPEERTDKNGQRFMVMTGEKLEMEQRSVEEWSTSEPESYDLVYDEMPVYNLDPFPGNRPLRTTAFGNALKPGGLLFIQTPGASNYSERKKLKRKVRGLYPDTHFEMIDTRRLTWVRQFLFMKTHVSEEVSD